jgi:hypothetical protein
VLSYIGGEVINNRGMSYCHVRFSVTDDQVTHAVQVSDQNSRNGWVCPIICSGVPNAVFGL